VQGRLQSRSWEQDGQKRNKVEVLASDVTFLDGNPNGDSTAKTPKPSEKSSSKDSSEKKDQEDVVIEDISDEPINLDDIPF